MNIMGNAVKFTPPGGGISIHIRENPSHIGGCGCYEFAFADTGIGMEAEYVLDGDSALARIAQTGFSAIILDWKMPGKDGLKTAKEIRRTGAHIPIIVLSAYDWTDIETEAQEAGVDAFISKPMFKSKLIHVLQSVLGGNDEEEGVNALETFQQQDYSGIRVLLVEDNDINVEVAQELLGIVGIQAETARAIRSSGREDLRSIPIIAMTADAFSVDIQKSRDAGMNDHISKPVDLGRLEEVLRKWIAQTGPKAKPSTDE